MQKFKTLYGKHKKMRKDYKEKIHKMKSKIPANTLKDSWIQQLENAKQ